MSCELGELREFEVGGYEQFEEDFGSWWYAKPVLHHAGSEASRAEWRLGLGRRVAGDS